MAGMPKMNQGKPIPSVTLLWAQSNVMTSSGLGPPSFNTPPHVVPQVGQGRSLPGVTAPAAKQVKPLMAEASRGEGVGRGNAKLHFDPPESKTTHPMGPAKDAGAMSLNAMKVFGQGPSRASVVHGCCILGGCKWSVASHKELSAHTGHVRADGAQV